MSEVSEVSEMDEGSAAAEFGRTWWGRAWLEALE